MTYEVIAGSYIPGSGRIEVTRQETLVAHPGDQNYAELASQLWPALDKQEGMPPATDA